MLIEDFKDRERREGLKNVDRSWGARPGRPQRAAHTGVSLLRAATVAAMSDFYLPIMAFLSSLRLLPIIMMRSSGL